MKEKTHLTRHQRKQQARETRNHGRNLRILYGGLAGTLLASAVVGYFSISASPSGVDASATPTAEAQQLSFNEQTIREQARAWGIPHSATEQALRQRGYEKSTKTFTPEEATEEALSRLRVAVDLMRHSEIEAFQTAAGIYSSKSVSVVTYTPEILEGRRPGTSSYIRPTENNEIRYITSLDEYVVTQLSSFGLAVVLVHESKHLDMYREHQKTLDPDLSAWERFMKYYELWEENHANIIEGEIETYALQSETYIIGVGMTGFKGEKDSSLEQMAAIYIRTGGINNPRWKEFIHKEVSPTLE